MIFWDSLVDGVRRLKPDRVQDSTLNSMPSYLQIFFVDSCGETAAVRMSKQLADPGKAGETNHFEPRDYYGNRSSLEKRAARAKQGVLVKTPPTATISTTHHNISPHSSILWIIC